jgi:preprotein translocase subunit SecA
MTNQSNILEVVRGIQLRIGEVVRLAGNGAASLPITIMLQYNAHAASQLDEIYAELKKICTEHNISFTFTHILHELVDTNLYLYVVLKDSDIFTCQQLYTAISTNRSFRAATRWQRITFSVELAQAN